MIVVYQGGDCVIVSVEEAEHRSYLEVEEVDIVVLAAASETVALVACQAMAFARCNEFNLASSSDAILFDLQRFVENKSRFIIGLSPIKLILFDESIRRRHHNSLCVPIQRLSTHHPHRVRIPVLN